jgi:hypothetical protein
VVLRGLALLAATIGLLFSLQAAWEQDRTYDEPYHLEWARRLLYEGVTERGSQPLWNSKTPVTMAHVLVRDAGRALGVSDPQALQFLSRIPSVACFAGLVVVTFVFARRRLGETAALLAVIALALDPSLIAVGALAVVDVPYALAALLALVAAVRLVEQPSPARAIALGCAVGFAFVTKLTAFLLLPILALLPACYGLARLGGWRRSLLLALVVALTALVFVDLAYLGTELFVPLRTTRWRSEPMLRLASALPSLRMPLSNGFLTGFDRTLAHERGRVWLVFIMDHVYRGGVWWFFLVSWVLKTPLLLLAALALGLARLARDSEPSPLRRFLAVNLVIGVAYFSFLCRAQLGYRQVLMCLPPLALLAGHGLASLPARRLTWGAGIVAAGALLELAPYAGNVYAFTSPLVEPKAQAFRYMAANIDLGQNDDKVLEWLHDERRRHPDETLLFDPAHIRPGLNVIDLNVLVGQNGEAQFRWLREHRNPVGHFDHTYLLFPIDAATYQQYLDEDRHFAPRPGDRATCAVEPAPTPIALDTWRRFPPTAPPGNGWLACVTTTVGADLALHGIRGGLLIGRAGAELRDFEYLWAGEQLVYRFDPGVYAMVVAKAAGFKGQVELLRGAAEIRLAPAFVRKGGSFKVLRQAVAVEQRVDDLAPE